MVDLEREDLSRLSSLLRAEAEALETKNFKLLERIEELDHLSAERDVLIKRLREDNIEINRDKNLFKVCLLRSSISLVGRV